MKRFGLMALCAFNLVTQARDIPFNEKPIALRFPVNKETIIKFPQPVRNISVLNEQSGDALSSFLSPDGVLYVTPTEKFDSTRMIADLADGQLVMLDVTVSDMGPFDTEIRIVDPKKGGQAVAATPQAPAAAAGTPSVPHPAGLPEEKNPYKPDFLEDGAPKILDAGGQGRAPGFHHMVQFGFRHFVGPERLIGDQLGDPVKVGKGEVGNMVRMNQGQLSVKPLRQWQIGDHYLTVLMVNNLSYGRYEFDPRAIRGRWVFAASLYPVIEGKGSQFDQTLWALISEIPFDKARGKE